MATAVTVGSAAAGVMTVAISFGGVVVSCFRSSVARDSSSGDGRFSCVSRLCESRRGRTDDFRDSLLGTRWCMLDRAVFAGVNLV